MNVRVTESTVGGAAALNPYREVLMGIDALTFCLVGSCVVWRELGSLAFGSSRRY